MDNKFKDAYFGKPYKTRDGRKAIYMSYTFRTDLQVVFIVLENFGITEYDYATGKCLEDDPNSDIISEWQESIDEKKLDELSLDYQNKMYGYSVNLDNDLNTDFSNQQNIMDIHEAFKAGYQKAKNF